MTDLFFRRRRFRRIGKSALTLAELLATGRNAPLSDYLSLSLSDFGQYTKISLTTTDAEPVTYSALLTDASQADLQSLVFVAQNGRQVNDPRITS